MKWTIFDLKYLLLIAIVIIISLTGCNNKSMNNYDDLAKCLTNKGMVMYGSLMCGHCNVVKKAFGDSFKYIQYVECSNAPGGNLELCTKENINYLPTFKWVGQVESGEIHPCDLAKKLGCAGFCDE